MERPVTARRILSTLEQVLYRRRVAACAEFVVLSQVAQSQLIDVRRGKGRHAVFNRIGQLVAVFVLCSPDFVTVAVVELDDRSHESPTRAAADARKFAALAAAAIPLRRFNVRAIPSEKALRALIAELRRHKSAAS